MVAAYSGKVFWSTGLPAQGAQLRLYEPLKSNAPDMEISQQPGLSGADGSFSLNLKDSPWLDTNLLDELSPLSAQFESVNSPGLHPSDTNRPALEITFQANGKPVQAYLPFRKLHRGYYLPLNPPVDFLPSRDGFAFINYFKPFDPPVSFPDWLGLRRIQGAYGLCGGMSSAAYDYRLARLANPNAPNIRQYTTIPNTGTVLHRFLLRRALDTFGMGGSMIAKVGEWTMLPDLGAAGVQKLTLDEFPTIQQKLDYGQCVVTTLIYVSTNDIKALPGKLCENHQVLAYGYTQTAPDTYAIKIYDCNFPDRDDALLQAQRVQVGVVNGQPVFGFSTYEVIPGVPNRLVRGFFEMPYQPAQPPAR